VQAPLIEERDSLKNSLEKLKIEYKILPETRKKIAELRRKNTEILKDFRRLESKIKRLEEAKLDSAAEAEIYRRQLNDYKKRYEQALKKNRILEKKIAQMPKKFAELARENKILIKQTALMHYNLGVFYTENKQYSRAIAEFEKAIELNPDDPYAHYNLGYIYAEYLVSRPKAIEHFRQYLRLAKTGDKDVDWVKKYILTWQTWEGKKPMK
jgi:tetratricopeptide (TPR) repeat protein